MKAHRRAFTLSLRGCESFRGDTPSTRRITKSVFVGSCELLPHRKKKSSCMFERRRQALERKAGRKRTRGRSERAARESRQRLPMLVNGLQR